LLLGIVAKFLLICKAEYCESPHTHTHTHTYVYACTERIINTQITHTNEVFFHNHLANTNST
jgi:hypothetical protein